jgi:glycosyltransferase involved in cell wall biosynthesis
MNEKIELTIICPAYNEEPIIEECLTIIYNYLTESITPLCVWELLIINDGSKDKTGLIAEEFIKTHKNVRLVNHFVNMNLGMAIKTGFANSNGKFIIVYDLDLSYSPNHIKTLYETIVKEKADIVIASPYMKGGKTTDVPFNRMITSKLANKYLSFTSRKKLHTFSGMVRAYRSSFIKNVSLKSTTFEINTEIVLKAQILRAIIIEIPAHLDWTYQNKYRDKRFSGIKLSSGMFNGIISGFIFRPYMFFFIPGFILFLVSMYIITWIFINTYKLYPSILVTEEFIDDKFSAAVSALFQRSPHAFFVGGFTLVVALQLLSIGFLSLQSKRYFDELFTTNTELLKRL